MKLRHRVSINIRQPEGEIQNVIRGGEVKIRERVLRWLFGEQKKVLVIAPGNSVFDVQIREHDFGKMLAECLCQEDEDDEEDDEEGGEPS